VEGQTCEPEREERNEPRGNRRREMNQGRFLVASALK
jgi:hypothetical protein